MQKGRSSIVVICTSIYWTKNYTLSYIQTLFTTKVYRFFTYICKVWGCFFFWGVRHDATSETPFLQSSATRLTQDLAEALVLGSHLAPSRSISQWWQFSLKKRWIPSKNYISNKNGMKPWQFLPFFCGFLKNLKMGKMFRTNGSEQTIQHPIIQLQINNAKTP